MSSKLLRNYLPEFVALGFQKSKPRMLTVNVTGKCNQHCVYCEIGKDIPSLRQDKLSIDDLKWIIDQMVLNKIKKLSLCGGEPFLFDGILDVVAYAGEQNIRCSITTNGMTAHRLSKAQLDLLVKYKTEINVSADSFDQEIETLTRGSAMALPNALKSIQTLNEHNIPLTVLTAISRYNYSDLFKSFVMAWEYGVKQVLFQPIIYYSNYPDREVIEEKSQLNIGVHQLDELQTELENILKFERKHAIKTNVYRIMPWINYYLKTAANENEGWFFDDVIPKFYCREIYAIIDISYDGGIQPCGLALANTDIYHERERGLLAMWHEATVQIRDDLSKGKYHDYCNGCCHHFSRNMLASLMRYPYQNRKALLGMASLLSSRMLSRGYKSVFMKS